MSDRSVHVSAAGIEFDGNDDLDCPYLGYVRVVPADGYIDVPFALVSTAGSRGPDEEKRSDGGGRMRLCRRCGCIRDAHEPLPAGSDCGACGRDACPRFRWSRRSAAREAVR